MRVEDMILISVDDHVVEPPDMWEGRAPRKYADQVPRLVVQDDGTEAWEYLGKRSSNAGLNAVAGRPPEDYGLDAQAFSDMRPGCYNVHERVRDMSANGVLGSMNFPSWAGFAARQFLLTPDKDLAIALLRAYNDGHQAQRDEPVRVGAAPPLDVPVVVGPQQGDGQVLVRGQEELAGGEARPGGEVHGSEHAIGAHVTDPFMDVVAARPHVAECLGVEPVVLRRAAGDGVEPGV